MKFNKAKTSEILEGDLTPMIDMTFQLIAFFMLLINFSEVDRAEEITLPLAVLAIPPETSSRLSNHFELGARRYRDLRGQTDRARFDCS